MGEVILRMNNIVKSFSGVKALKDGALTLESGEVVALMGENGAGKSTLMKILTGIYQKDSGTIVYFGEEVAFSGTKESEEAGIAIVHQELNMMSDLTVAQNLFIGHELMNGCMINDKEMNKKAAELFKLLNIEIDPAVKIGELTVGKQQMVEIAKAISGKAKIIIFDEPTAALTTAEIDELFKVIKDLRAKGTGIIYISHRMDEINVISDKVTVMRDGEYVGTLVTKDCTKADIIQMMVGRTIFLPPKTKSQVPDDAPVVLECKDITRGKCVKNASFQLRKGEILGFSGLMGAGRTELARIIFGADKPDSGEIFIDGKRADIQNPKDAVEYGIGYLSEDRKRYGLIVDKPIAENTVIATLREFLNGFLINQPKIDTTADDYAKDLKIKMASVTQMVRKLSGGNQQKVVIAKWLCRDSDILIFDEPTRGIDVGAKSEIYNLMEELVKEGKSIIMISSELPEVLRMSDRVIVMCEGRITATYNIEDATQENIMQAATNR